MDNNTRERLLERLIHSEEKVKIAFFAVMLANAMSDDSSFFDDYSTEELEAAAAYIREAGAKLPDDTREWFSQGTAILGKEIDKRHE